MLSISHSTLYGGSFIHPKLQTFSNALNPHSSARITAVLSDENRCHAFQDISLIPETGYILDYNIIVTIVSVSDGTSTWKELITHIMWLNKKLL